MPESPEHPLRALRRWWHRQITWIPRPCGEPDCCLKVCVADRRMRRERSRKAALARCRANPWWNETTMQVEWPGRRPVTFMQVWMEGRHV